MNSIMRLILWGKGISLSAEKVPKSLRNMACFIHSVCTGKSRANRQSSENSSNVPMPQDGRKKQGTCWKLPLPPAKVPGGVCWTSPPVSGRTAISRGRNSCCGPNPQVFLLADLSQKSKDQRAAPTSASAAPGMRGGEAHICCLNTDREHVGPPQHTGVRSQLDVQHSPPHPKGQTAASGRPWIFIKKRPCVMSV